MKTFLIDAIVGVGLPSILLAQEAERVGMADFCGNQHNPSWAWHRDKLERLEEPQLQELYQSLREARDELSESTDAEGVIHAS